MLQPSVCSELSTAQVGFWCLIHALKACSTSTYLSYPVKLYSVRMRTSFVLIPWHSRTCSCPYHSFHSDGTPWGSRHKFHKRGLLAIPHTSCLHRGAAKCRSGLGRSTQTACLLVFGTAISVENHAQVQQLQLQAGSEASLRLFPNTLQSASLFNRCCWTIL